MSLNKKWKQLKADHILAVLFLLFSLYVGSATIPVFIQNTLDADKANANFNEYIDLIDSQYHDVLNTNRDTPYLQNKGSYIDLCGLMANVLNQHTANGRTKLTNGHLTLTNPKYDPMSVQESAQNIIRFYQKQASLGKDFLFVLAPSQVYSDALYLPDGFSSTEKSNAELFVSILLENDVPVLDLRNKMNEQNISYTDAFYMTDHHWKTEYGFWAMGEIIKELETMGYASTRETKLTSPENYDFITYENCFLGSSGKRTGKYFAGTDDFTLIVPKYDTEITVTIQSKNISKTGRFEDVSATNSRIGMEMRLSDPDYFNDDPYGRIGYGNTPMTNWRNPNAPENKKFLLIGDSMANIPFTFMTLYNSICDELDMRHYTDDFENYFTAYSPDLVLICVNQYGIIGNEAENVTYNFVPEA